MARRISDEEIRLNIIINGNNAQKEIIDLTKANENLKTKIEDLKKQDKARLREYNQVNKAHNEQKKEIDKIGQALVKLNDRHEKEISKLKQIEIESGKTSKQYKKQELIVKGLEREGEKLFNTQQKESTAWLKNSESVKKVNQEFTSFRAEIAGLENELESNNNKLETLYSNLSITDMTMRQLQRQAAVLKSTIANLSPNDSDLTKFNTELAAITLRIAELGGKVKLTDLSVEDLTFRAKQLEDALKLDLPTEKTELYSNELRNVNERLSELNGTMDVNEMSIKQLEFEISRLNKLYAESKPGTKEMEEYNQKISTASLRLKELKGNLTVTDMTMQQLEAEAKRLGTEMSNISRSSNEFLRLDADLGRVQSRMAQLNNNYNLLEMSSNDLTERSRFLQAAIDSVRGNPERVQEYESELQEVSDRLEEIRGGGEEASFSLGSMADKFNRYAGIIASFIAGLTGIVLSIQKVIDFNKKLADSISDVQKTTGMSKMEVEDLIKTFGKLHTRTSKMELLGIAEIGGKLGIAKEEIADFVRVMDKSAVALGDAFEGGPEVVAEKLGRIKGLYEELRNSGVEAAFESVGSALNDLGAAGTASEQNVAEFVQRVGAMPSALKPSIQEALGLGAAFEESGLKAELAGNNYSKVISIAARDSDRFAKVMRRPVQEIKNLINTNPTEFFLQFAKSVQGLQGTDLSKVLDYLKLNDNEVKMVMGAASERVEMFRDKIKLAGESMAEATSLTDEFNIKNNNLAATLERLQKKVMGWFTSDSVVAFLTSAVDKLAKFVGAIEDSEGSMTTLRNGIVLTAKLLSILVVGMISYTTAAKLAALWSNNVASGTLFMNLALKANLLMLSLEKAALTAYVAVMNIFRRSTDAATARLVVLNRVAALNPWGAVFAVIGALITAYAVFSNKVTDAMRVQKMFNDVHLETQKSISGEVLELDRLKRIAANENMEKEKRIAALKKLNEMMPDHIQKLTLENITTKEGTAILKQHTDELYRNARARTLNQKLGDLDKELHTAENKTSEDYKNFVDKSFDAVFGTTDAVKDREEVNKKVKERLRLMGKSRVDDMGVEYFPKQEFEEMVDDMMKTLGLHNKEQEIQSIKNQMDALKKEIDANAVIDPNATTDSKSGNAWVPSGDEKEGERAATKARKLRYDAMMKSLEDAKKIHEDSTDLERKAIDERLALMQDGFDKEEAIEAENHRRKLQDLQKQLISEEEFAKLQEKINDATLSPQERGAYNHIKYEWANKNKHINTLIELEEGRHQLALETISTKAETKRITGLQADFEREAMLRKAAHNEELAALGNNERAKERLEREFNLEETQRQKDFLQDLIDEKQKIIEDKNNQIEFGLLTPEQITQFENDIAKLKLESSELAKILAELHNKNGSDKFGPAAKNVFGGTDVLGFTADQWGQTFNNIDTLQGKMAAATMVVGALKNAWGTYNDYLSANEENQLAKYERGLDTRKKRLKSQLDNGYINQVQYQRELTILEAQTEKKRAEIEYKQAKRQKAISIANIILNTAQAIMGIWAQFPKHDFGATAAIMSGVVGALGAVQLATVIKTPLPAKGYEKGLYPEYVKREQDGKTFRAGYGGKTRSGMVNKPTYFLAGENGPEMVIDAAAYRQMSPSTKNLLIRELRGIKGFEQGYYNNDVTGGGRVEVPVSNSPAQPAGISLEVALQIIAQNTAVMEKIQKEGITAYYNKDPRDLKKMMEDMDRLTQSRTKAKN